MGVGNPPVSAAEQMARRAARAPSCPSEGLTAGAERSKEQSGRPRHTALFGTGLGRPCSSGTGLRVPVSTFSMDATKVCDPASVVYEVSALGGVVHVSISRGAVGRFTIICGDSPRFSTKCDNTGPMFRLEIAPR